MKLRGPDLAAVSLLALLGACGGSGQDPVTASNCGVVGGICTSPVEPEPTPLPQGLLDVETLTAYKAVGGTQQLTETFTREEATETSPSQLFTQELYTAEQSKADTNQVRVSFDPRNAVFTLTAIHEGANTDVRFQDPAHRIDFDGNSIPQAGVPDLPGFNYFEVGSEGPDGSDIQTFFYLDPTGTRHATIAGFSRNIREGKVTEDFELQRVRGAYVFGNQTPAGAVPTRGTGSYTGAMIATMVRNSELDEDPDTRSRFEWISGTAKVQVDFGKSAVSATFDGNVRPTLDAFEELGDYNTRSVGAAFSASGSASLDASRQYYTGTIDRASVDAVDINIARSSNLDRALSSSIDGTFYGPGAAETGGAFRIVGTTPDERVDIIGSFVGARPPQ